MVVQHNISAMTANRYYGINNSALGKSLEKLSSGYAINRAGDNAAGLAVSEKMRAQIAGLTQASKNAQDGISMVQTFEGALQETDSILQRMRTIAVQSANGSYQNDVDRDALQLEFDQLNDELNQIADTDFNGVVALNGGTMADGLQADKDGNFDYSDKKNQVQAKVTAKLTDTVNAAKANLDKVTAEQKALVNNAKKAMDGKFDLSESVETVWNTVDNNSYGSTSAGTLWTAAKLALTNPGDQEIKADELDVTYTYQLNAAGDGYEWKATSATAYSNGDKVAVGLADDGTGNPTSFDKDAGTLDMTAIQSTLSATEATQGNATGKGGFIVGTNGVYGNAIFDATDVTAGSTVTLKYTNSSSSGAAPNNIGFAEDSKVLEKGNATGATDPTLTIALGNVKDTDMNDELKADFDGLNGLTFKAEYNSTDGTSVTLSFTGVKEQAAIDEAKAKVDSLAEQGITSGTEYTAANDALTAAQSKVQSATVKQKGTPAENKYDGDGTNGQSLVNTTATNGWHFTTTDENGDVHHYMAKADTSDNNKIGIYHCVVGGTEASPTYTAGTQKLAELTIKDCGDAVHATEACGNVASGVISLDKASYSAGLKPTLTTADDPNLGSKDSAVKNYNAALKTQETAVKAAQKQLDDATSELKYFSGDVNKDADLWNATQKKFSTMQSTGDSEVAIADRYDNSKSRLTYTQNMTLQTGARSKDLIQFTFNYSSNGLGDLKANMNCSAREDGLGTSTLSVRTQENANAAIDKIDNAINKISMVRGTFGAIQNRLEHKINNIDTNTENLTAAESRIRDTQMDQEMMKFTSAQILSQASQSMLAQANSLPQGVLQLLG